MKTYFTFLLVIVFFASGAQTRQKAFEINQKLGRGINYGNMLEAPTETEWGNPWQPEYAGIIADLGFNHVRIPIRWEPAVRSSANSPYTINSVFLDRVKQVVDSALNKGLYAIIDMHHHEALYENPEGQKARFLAQWKQISEFFADYPDKLLFEVLNEPHGNLTAAKWNVFLASALTTIREKNPDRIVLIGTAEYGGLGGLSKLHIPDDENIILTAHYYNPFNFTHQGADWVEGANDWLGTKWSDSDAERQAVQNEFAALKAFEESKHIPIHIGEFGSYSTADNVSRAKWTTYIARYIESLNWSWAYWEFSAGFGIYNNGNKTYNQELVDALLHNKMPEAASYVGTPIYTSDFPASISDWDLTAQGGAGATATKIDNNMEVLISAGGSETWHIQLVKNNIVLEKGKKYRLTFKAKAASPRQCSAYVGQSSSPWNAYSGYTSIALADTFSVYTIVFDANTNDNVARIAFDFGTSTTNVVLEYVTLEAITLQQLTSTSLIKDVKSKIYPNPFNNNLSIDNQDDFEQVEIMNMQGRILKKQKLNNFQNVCTVSDLPSGIYFVTLCNQENRFTTQVIKN